MTLLVCVPALVLALLGYVLIVLLLRRASAARRHLTLRGLLVVSCALPLFAPLLLFVPKVPVISVSAKAVQAAPAWTPESLLPKDDWRVRGTALDLTPGQRRSQFDASAVWNAINLLAILLMSAATVRAGRRVAALKATARPGGDFEGIPVLFATDPRLAVPIAFGSRIMLPAAATEWPETRIRAALAHEAAHVRRGDWGWTIAARAACTFFWYSPGLWLVARALRATAEVAADDAVLAAGVRPSDYARELLAVSQTLGSPDRVALGMVGRGGLRGRVAAVLTPGRDRRHASRSFGIVAGLALFGVALVSASLGVQMPHLTMESPPGAQVVEAGEPVRRGGTTLWLDSVHSVTKDRVVSWDSGGKPTDKLPDALAILLNPGPHEGHTILSFGAIRRDPGDTYTFRLPDSVWGFSCSVPRAGARDFRIDVDVRGLDERAYSTDLGVGVASGPWSSEIPILESKSMDASSPFGEGAIFLQFELPKSARDAECRAAVRLTNGRIAVALPSATNWKNWGAEQHGQVTVRLAPGERVARVELQARPYRWAFIRDVPLVPGPAARARGRRPILRRLDLPSGPTYLMEGVR